MDLGAALLPVVLDAVKAVLAILVPWILARGVAYLDARIENERITTALDRTSDAVADVVEELAQTVVDDLKEDGRFDLEEADALKRKALGKIKHNLGPKALKEIRKTFGLGSQRELDEALTSKIEAEVRRTKGLARIAEAASVVED